MAARFSFYYAAVFLVVGIHVPFWPAWLAWRGLDAGEISLILSASIWVRAFANPVIAHFADRSGAHRTIIMVSAGLGTLAFLIFPFAEGFWMMLAANLLAGSLFMALIPLGENLASRSAGTYGFDYGRVRLWGSITFVLAAYAGGFAIERSGDQATLWMLVAAMCMAFLAACGMPRRRRPPEPRRGLPALELLRSKPFLVFILAVSLLQASHAVLYLFGTLHWREAGISNTVIGLLWAEGVAAEIFLFAFSGAVTARVRPIVLMLVAAGAGVIRWVVIAQTTDVATLFCVQWLHGLTFGAAHLAAIHYMLRTVPDRMSASAQSLYSGFAIGFVMGLVMLVGGQLYQTSASAAFLSMAVLSVAGGLAALWLATFRPSLTQR